MEIIEIKSFVGVPPFIFGEKFEKIMNLLSKESRVVTKHNICKVYATPFSLKFVDDILTEVSILDSTNVFFEGHNVFGDNFVEYLKEQYTPVYKYGSLIFDEIGIALYGYVESEEQKVVSVYKKNGWDSILNN